MAKPVPKVVPPLLSPLTHDQHAQLGRIAILWGQIDMYLDNMLDEALQLRPKQRMALIGDKPMHAKLEILSANFDELKDDTMRKLVREFWDLCNQTKTQRNRAFHGVWGWYARSPKDVFPAAQHMKAREQPVKAADLAMLEQKLCHTVNVGHQALQMVKPFMRYAGAARLFHGPEGDPPEWLSEWTEQHPLDDLALDHSWKQGQLPFLERPL